jgi:tetratricopeptide (TPR) repeat protein
MRVCSALYRHCTCSGPAVATQRRFQSSRHTPWRKDTTSVFVEESFAKHTLFALDVGKRALKFSSIGLLALGTTAAAVYEGVHMWVENVELASEADEEVRKWEWDQEYGKWTGVSGGTDPGLGLKGRHIVRAAWMAYNWGVGFSTSVIGSAVAPAGGLVGPGGIKVIDASLQRTDDFLRTAISIAEKRLSYVRPQTITELIARHAAVLERLGQQFLPESKAQYERVWASLSGKGPDAVRTALKLGDLCSRLGQKDDALAWWSRAISLIRGETLDSIDNLPAVLDSAPSSPSGQRSLSAALVSLSAFYATSGQLHQAQSIEEAGLKVLRSIRPPESFASASPPQSLHALYLLQRSSLLSMHLAEVLHAQRKPAGLCMQWLTSAAESSERVARALTGHSPSQNEFPEPLKNPLSPELTFSHSIKKAAHGLLRDSRRTAAEAWNLMGVLNEAQGENVSALRCYERAVDWAGTSTDHPDVKRAAEGTLETDWAVFWGNYMRIKELVKL